MSAYKFNSKQVDSLQSAINDRLNKLKLHPPSVGKGKDVVMNHLSTKHTLELLKRNDVN